MPAPEGPAKHASIWPLICGVFLLSLAGCSGGGADQAAEAAKAARKVEPEVINQRLDELQACSVASGRKQGITGSNYAEKIAATGVQAELLADARLIASERLAVYNQLSAPKTDVQRVNNALAAIDDMVYFTKYGPAVNLRARIYHAYYESKLSGQDCPVPPDLLALINKA
jgi:hypothetical protein